MKNVRDANRATTDFSGGIVEGANVRTPCGPRRIELVRPGDLIVTRDNGLQPVRMLWKREVRHTDMALNPDLAPICLKPRAVGPMMPQRDLSLARDHRILIPGYRLLGQDKTNCCFVQAAHLAGASDSAFVDRSPEVVRFYTLVFDCHQVFVANGLPVESFLPTKASVAALDENLKEDLMRRFPQLKREPGAYPPAEYAAPKKVEYLAGIA